MRNRVPFTKRVRVEPDPNQFQNMVLEELLAMDEINDIRNTNIQWYNMFLEAVIFFIILMMVVFPTMSPWGSYGLVPAILTISIVHHLGAYATGKFKTLLYRVITLIQASLLGVFLLVIIYPALYLCNAPACINGGSRIFYILLYIIGVVIVAMNMVIFCCWAPALGNAYVQYHRQGRKGIPIERETSMNMEPTASQVV